MTFDVRILDALPISPIDVTERIDNQWHAVLDGGLIGPVTDEMVDIVFIPKMASGSVSLLGEREVQHLRAHGYEIVDIGLLGTMLQMAHRVLLRKCQM